MRILDVKRLYDFIQRLTVTSPEPIEEGQLLLVPRTGALCRVLHVSPDRTELDVEFIQRETQA